MRANLCLLAACCIVIGCQKKGDDNTAPPATDTTQRVLYPDTILYTGTMHFSSWHDNGTTNLPEATIDTHYYRAPVSVVFPDSNVIIFNFGYWDHYDNIDPKLYYIEEVKSFQKTNSNHYSTGGSGSWIYDVHGDSLLISYQHEVGTQYQRKATYAGIKAP